MVKTFHYCDRCGVEISEKSQDIVFRGHHADDSLEISDVIELCSDCKEKLFDWLRTPYKDEPVAEQIEETTVDDPAVEQIEESDEKFAKLMDEKIEILNLPVREYNCLRRCSIDTVGMLCDLSEKDLSHVKGLGKRSIEKIKSTLEERGLSLYDEVA